MKNRLAISNIAWTEEEDDEIYLLMEKNGFRGLEIAPTKIWENPYEQDEKAIRSFKDGLKKNNLSVVAFQSLLFGHPEMSIFQRDDLRKKTLEHLGKNIELAGRLGATALVFGSPKNRLVGNVPQEEIREIATEFFGQLGDMAIKNNAVFCIEPNPRIYGGDFILTTKEAVSLVKNINHPGFKINIDLGTITANNEDIEETLEEALPYAGHFHISEPNLVKIERDFDKHRKIQKIIETSDYSGTISVEMKNAGPGTSNINNIKEVLEFISDIYGK